MQNLNKMKYYLKCIGIGLEDDELLIDCELQIGDHCAVEVENETDNETKRIVVTKREYYPQCGEWIFWCALANER